MPYKTGIRLLGVARNPANGFPARLLGTPAGDSPLVACQGRREGVPLLIINEWASVDTTGLAWNRRGY